MLLLLQYMGGSTGDQSSGFGPPSRLLMCHPDSAAVTSVVPKHPTCFCTKNINVLPAVQVSENCNMASSFTSICRSRFRSSLAFCIICRRKLEISQHQKDDRRDQNTDCSAVSWLKHFTTDWWAGSNGDRFRKAKIGVLVFPECSMKKCPSNDSGTVSN